MVICDLWAAFLCAVCVVQCGKRSEQMPRFCVTVEQSQRVVVWGEVRERVTGGEPPPPTPLPAVSSLFFALLLAARQGAVLVLLANLATKSFNLEDLFKSGPTVPFRLEAAELRQSIQALVTAVELAVYFPGGISGNGSAARVAGSFVAVGITLYVWQLFESLYVYTYHRREEVSVWGCGACQRATPWTPVMEYRSY